MAAARQKEMNVSITEDATISRTRSEEGATVVRLDAIAIVPVRLPALSNYRNRNHHPPCMSLFLIHRRVNKISAWPADESARDALNKSDLHSQFA